MCAFLGGKRAGRQAGLGRGYVNISVVSQNWGICLYVCVCGVPGVVCKLFFFFLFCIYFLILPQCIYGCRFIRESEYVCVCVQTVATVPFL